MARTMTSGLPYPLGATWDGRGVNFALFSAHAERVELCLFEPSGRREVERITLPEYTDQIWHGYLADASLGLLYGYRVYGPYEPHLGHRFNPNKLLLDPYARLLKGTLQVSGIHKAYRTDSRSLDLSFDRRDSAHRMPKCVVVDPAFSWSNTQAPQVPWDQTVIYETHVRGFTIRHSGVLPEHRGTYHGMSNVQIIAYLKALGITTVELMPVHAFVDEQFLREKKLRNYWGYNTIGFFSPEPRYFASSSIHPHAGADLAEFKMMVARFHDAGMEVILDVVYNHTAEGNEMGPTLSFRGIDNASYYRLQRDNQRYYINDTGCGNTLNICHPRVLQMVMDSLRYWATEMQIDGFRFDLSTILGRELTGFDPGSGFFDTIRQDPVLATKKLIAEPWDIGPGGYQLGNFPCGWSEWNDQFRDTARRFWRGDDTMMSELARRLHGSSDTFEHHGRRPRASINYVASHDGFTLADVVSYLHRHNEANGENNQDGHRSNFSSNHDVEGPTDDCAVLAARAQHQRNLLATVFIAQGTPMLSAGDERGNSQHGNNNAYCQDNEISWLDWTPLDPDSHQGKMHHFVQQLIQLRRDFAVLRRQCYRHGRDFSPVTGFPDIQWLSSEGGVMSNEQWHQSEAACFGMLLAGDTKDEQTGVLYTDQTLLVIFNACRRQITFSLPVVNGHWACLLSTAETKDVDTDRLIDAAQSSALLVPEHSTLVLVLKPVATNLAGAVQGEETP